jgi:hypothetical protein
MSVAKISEKRGTEEGEVSSPPSPPMSSSSSFFTPFSSPFLALPLRVSLAATRQGRAETPEPSSMARKGLPVGSPWREAKAGELVFGF